MLNGNCFRICYRPLSSLGRSRQVDLRAVVNAIFYLVAAGCAWRLLPPDFPHWETVYHYFRQWRWDGTWERIHQRLVEWVRVMDGATSHSRCRQLGFAIGQDGYPCVDGGGLWRGQKGEGTQAPPHGGYVRAVADGGDGCSYQWPARGAVAVCPPRQGPPMHPWSAAHLGGWHFGEGWTWWSGQWTPIAGCSKPSTVPIRWRGLFYCPSVGWSNALGVGSTGVGACQRIMRFCQKLRRRWFTLDLLPKKYIVMLKSLLKFRSNFQLWGWLASP